MVERRAAVAAALVLAATLGLAALTGSAAAKHGAKSPNVLIIVTDDQRDGTVEAADPADGGPWMRNVLKWFRDGDPSASPPVERGAEFQSAFAVTPLCCPSRASIFTGRYPHNHNVKANAEANNLGLSESSPGQLTTLQRYLKAQRNPQTGQPGYYKTGVFGKYLNDWVGTNGSTAPPYFDRFSIFDRGYLSPGENPGCGDEADPELQAEELCVNDQGELVELPEYSTRYVSDKAVDFLDYVETDPSSGEYSNSEDRRPWFMYVAPTAPHLPATPEPDDPSTPQVEEGYENTEVPVINDQIPPFFPGHVNGKPNYVQSIMDNAQMFPAQLPAGEPCPPIEVTQEGTRGYKNCIRYHRAQQFRALKSVDDMVGRIFAELRAKGEENDTIAFFVSDNGYLWGEFWLAGKPHPWNGSIAVPMYMRWPGHPDLHAPNRVDPRLVANIDIAPTVMAAVGYAPDAVPPEDAQMDGKNLMNPLEVRIRLLLERPVAAGPNRTWGAILQSPGQAGPPESGATGYYHYIEHYSLTDLTSESTTSPFVVFQEYYDLENNFIETMNCYGDDGVPTLLLGSGDDCTPSAATLSSWLDHYLNCKGPESPPRKVPDLEAAPRCP